MQNKLNIAIFPTIISSYREDFYRRVISNKSFYVTLFCQDSIPFDKQNVINEKFSSNLIKLKYTYFRRNNIIWQYLPYKYIKENFDIYLIVGNPRVITDVILSLYLRLLGKKVIIWVMVQSHRGIKVNLYIRLLWYSFFKFIFVYNENEEAYLRKIFKKKIIVSMNNGLNYEKINSINTSWDKERLHNWRVINNLIGKDIFISSSRLKKKNNFSIIIESIYNIVQKKNYTNLLWFIIGDGEERMNLEKQVKKYNLTEHIVFLGEIYDDNFLSPYFLSSIFFLHPEAIGLSILHAFSYGLPIVLGDDFLHHGPEIVVFINGYNGLSFKNGCSLDLQNKIETLLHDKYLCNELSNNALLTARDKYNTRIMAEKFNDLIINVNK